LREAGRLRHFLFQHDPGHNPAEDEQWFVIFEFRSIGYVRDTERDQLDADKLLASLSANTEAANAERRKRGWNEMHVAGWATPPNYDPMTNNRLCPGSC
jgi:uncharacterized membrane-anchored protein